ncbi:MFS transporter [Kaistella jeonii]|uniref:MFS transporter n=1 Tax=Kaistella jeonii TaxID=266749 RepID=A0A0C1FP97_9FLAO|nr:MFS transporter [Kaistella jeonii]KIA89694.1 MFS transporter [Kaistella jeonii]SFB88212.1 Fucose permease [Kaistella jeonii]VEI95917.1 Inner membrane protein ybjJ [Kaistella jeonii]
MFSTPQKQRIALSSYFFLSGLCFSTWASRIPTIKSIFNLTEGDLGNLLMIMPASAIVGIPLSGWLVAKYDSRIPLQLASVLFLLSLFSIGWGFSLIGLVISLVLFSIALRIINVAINTQSLSIQQKFKKRIMGKFHGVWSIGGIAGVLFSTIMLKYEVSIFWHFLMIMLFGLLIIICMFPFLIKNDKVKTSNPFKFQKPSKYISLLGFMVFFAAVCEGGMYDWNGVYLKEIVKQEVFTYGYLLFMVCMTISRLTIDNLMSRFGMQKLFITSSILIISGVLIAIVFPFLVPVLIGFCMVGFGVSGLFPMTFILAGKAKKYSVPIVISIISTYSTVGMFLGPPIIGYLASAFGLQKAFITFIVAGIMFIPLSKMVFDHLKKTN